MSYAMDYHDQRLAAEASADARAAFMRRTYLHLAGAILAFTGIETVLVQSVSPEFIGNMIGTRVSWLLVLGAFMAVSWIANAWARSNTSQAMQYAGLALYVVAEAVVFLPLLYIAAHFAAPDVIPKAGIMTLALFAGLTFTAFVTGKDFSFLGSILSIACWLALGLIVCSMLLGFTLGTLFAGAMVVVACGFILYDTSNIMYHYRTDQHVAASLALFASVALLFWYILQILMSSSSRD